MSNDVAAAGFSTVFDAAAGLTALRSDEGWRDLYRLGLDYIEMGGWVMLPLLITLILLWYGIGYRFTVLKRVGDKSPRVLVEGYADGKWTKPRDIVQRAIVKGWQSRPVDGQQTRLFLDDAFSEFEEHLQRFVALVRVIVGVAPLLGLLGTVTGMIETFDSLQDSALFSQTGGIASGISQALLTTQLGLSIAIPGLLLQGYLNRKQNCIISDLEQVKELLVKRQMAVAKKEATA